MDNIASTKQETFRIEKRFSRENNEFEYYIQWRENNKWVDLTYEAMTTLFNGREETYVFDSQDEAEFFIKHYYDEPEVIAV